VNETDLVAHVCEQTAALHRRVGGERQDDIVRAAQVVRTALLSGRKVLVFGNGGSAADAQHFAAELVGRFGHHVSRPAWPVMALVSDPAIVSAVSNDFGFEAAFARQVEAWGTPGDVALALTTSGASPNVNEALRCARSRSMVTVALTGRDGGESGRLAHVHVNVPAVDPQRVQEVQQTVLHIICELVERGATASADDETHA
jgi:D-sedoheptulose 7-phosphate isomerase